MPILLFTLYRVPYSEDTWWVIILCLWKIVLKTRRFLRGFSKEKHRFISLRPYPICATWERGKGAWYSRLWTLWYLQSKITAVKWKFATNFKSILICISLCMGKQSRNHFISKFSIWLQKYRLTDSDLYK